MRSRLGCKPDGREVKFPEMSGIEEGEKDFRKRVREIPVSRERQGLEIGRV
jgi:hypothetical protein